MRAAWIIYGALEQATGGYVYDRLMVEALRRAGVTVTIVSIDPGDEVTLPVDVDCVIGDALCIPEIAPLFERVPVKRVLLVHHLTSWEHEVDDRERWQRLEARALAAADVIVTTSETTAARLGLSARVVLPGADRLPLAPREPRGLSLLGVGSIISRKRWIWVLDALDTLRDSRMSLRLVGDDARDRAYTRALDERIAASPWLRTHVERLGMVNDETLTREYACATALILPSSLEGYGMVLTEALHAGLPVFAAHTSATREATSAAPHSDSESDSDSDSDSASDSESGAGTFLFKNPFELGRGLHRLAHDERWRRELEAGAGRRVLPRWADAGVRFVAAITS